MITVFFTLPFERQIRKLYLAEFENFFIELKKISNQNGGIFLSEQNIHVIKFSESMLANMFSASRFLILLKHLIESSIYFIKEYKIIIDIYDDSLSNTHIFDEYLKFRKELLPDNQFYVTNRSKEHFEKYISCAKLQSKQMHYITNFLMETENIDNESNEQNQPSIVIHRGNSFIWALYNFILQNPLYEKDLEILSEEEKLVFSQTKTANMFLKKHRFDQNFPQYFLDAFLMFTSLYFKIYKQKNKLPIIYSADLRNVDISAEIEKILSIIPEAEIKELPKNLPDIMSFPKDLMEIVFLIITASQYIFIDEIPTFLLFLNKDLKFFDDVYMWLFKNNLIFERNNIFARYTHLPDFIESTITDRISNLKQILGNFLISKYQIGELYPSHELLKVFSTFGVEPKAEFELSIFLHQNSNIDIAKYDIKSKFEDSPFYEALKYFQHAISTDLNQIQSIGLPAAKKAITSFQQNGLAVGEYKAMILLGFLHLRQNSLSDAISYFSYSLDIANHLHNSEFICESLFNIGITYFLQNDLKMSLSFFYKLTDIIQSHFEQTWHIKSLFMQARILFEIGDYKGAEKLFSNATDFAEQYFPDLQSICEVWCARALTYSGQTITATKILEKNINTRFDSNLFLLESFLFTPVIKDESNKLFLEGTHENEPITILIKQIIENIGTQASSEEYSLQSGFSLAEDLIWNNIYGIPLNQRLFTTLYHYYKFKIELLSTSIPKSENKELRIHINAIIEMANIALSYKDPLAHFYLYLCYDVSLKQNGPSASETTGFLSKAFKSLQRRLISISENDIRDKYMNKNYWNAKLFKAAQENKLI